MSFNHPVPPSYVVALLDGRIGNVYHENAMTRMLNLQPGATYELDEAEKAAVVTTLTYHDYLESLKELPATVIVSSVSVHSRIHSHQFFFPSPITSRMPI